MIGIYGGTFDPVHYGHLRTALEVADTLELDELRFLPCGLPPHRKLPEAAGHLRLQMLELALCDADPRFRIDCRELKREGPSYMVDTLRSLRGEIGRATPLCLIVGMDAFRGLQSWYRWQELFDLAHLIVMGRPGTRAEDDAKTLRVCAGRRQADQAGMLRMQPSGLVYFAEVTQLAIAATRIRQLIHSGHDPRYLLPDPVLEFIRQQGLYRVIEEV
jgi:nicotinate-nucleotide adenylyltransferase